MSSGWVFAARRELSAALLIKVRDAMLRLDPKNPVHRPILLEAHFHAIIQARDSDFDPVRRIERSLGLAPAKDLNPRGLCDPVRRNP